MNTEELKRRWTNRKLSPWFHWSFIPTHNPRCSVGQDEILCWPYQEGRSGYLQSKKRNLCFIPVGSQYSPAQPAFDCQWDSRELNDHPGMLAFLVALGIWYFLGKPFVTVLPWISWSFMGYVKNLPFRGDSYCESGWEALIQIPWPFQAQMQENNLCLSICLGTLHISLNLCASVASSMYLLQPTSKTFSPWLLHNFQCPS